MNAPGGWFEPNPAAHLIWWVAGAVLVLVALFWSLDGVAWLVARLRRSAADTAAAPQAEESESPAAPPLNPALRAHARDLEQKSVFRKFALRRDRVNEVGPVRRPFSDD